MIAGIDPGTTVGWAIFTLNGKFVAAGSQKELDADELISKLISYGKLVFIGTDKAKIPFFVQNIATKTGARIVAPLQDVSVEQKRELAHIYYYNNAHEMDAISAAVLAFRKSQPLLHKINSFLSKENKLSLFEHITQLVIKEKISIRSALASLEPPEPVPKVNVSPAPQQPKDRLLTLLAKYQKDNELLVKRNNVLGETLQVVRKKLELFQKQKDNFVKTKTPKEELALKERQIAIISQKLLQAQQLHKRFSYEREKLEKALLDKSTIAIPRISRINSHEVSRLRFFDSIIFVDDARQMGETALEYVKSKGVLLIISPFLPSNQLISRLPFSFIRAANYEAFPQLALIDRNWLASIRSEREVLAHIVQEYKLARERVHEEKYQG